MLESAAAGVLVLVALAFATGLSAGSVAIWRVMDAWGSRGPLLSAIANVIAGALFVAMVTVQLAVKDVADPPEEGLRAVYWGPDVA